MTVIFITGFSLITVNKTGNVL